MVRPAEHERNKGTHFHPRSAEEWNVNSLIKWLNTDSDTGARARVCELLTLCKELNALCQPMVGRKRARLDPNIDRLTQEINSRLERYQAVRLVSAIGGGITVWWGLKGRGRTSNLSSLFHMKPADWEKFVRDTEFHMVSLLMDVVKMRLLPKIGRCECAAFFYARSSLSRFCSAGCRVTYWENSQDRKAQKRRKAREYYWLHKNKNTK